LAVIASSHLKNDSLITSEEILSLEELPAEVLDYTEHDLLRVKSYFTKDAFLCLQKTGNAWSGATKMFPATYMLQGLQAMMGK
jgi:hypothetical protein